MGRYRGKLKIIADILSVVSDGAKKTHVMYQANLSYALLSRYLNEVLDAGLVSVDPNEYYMLTEKGQDFLDRFSEYSQRYLDIEEQLSNVNNEKALLEDMIETKLDKESIKSNQKNKAKRGDVNV